MLAEISSNDAGLNNFRYADDTVISADSADGLQMNKVVEISGKYDLGVHINKTKNRNSW